MMKVSYLFVTISTLLLFACGNVPVTSIPKINKIDPRTTELASMRMVAKVPNAIDISKLKVIYEAEISAADQEKKVTSNLIQVTNDPNANALISREQEDGYQLRAYRLSRDDIIRLEELRQQGFAWKEEGLHTKGSLEYRLQGFCYDQSMETENLKADLWVRTSETVEFVHTLKKLDVSASQFEKEGGNPDDIGCQTTN